MIFFVLSRSLCLYWGTQGKIHKGRINANPKLHLSKYHRDPGLRLLVGVQSIFLYSALPRSAHALLWAWKLFPHPSMAILLLVPRFPKMFDPTRLFHFDRYHNGRMISHDRSRGRNVRTEAGYSLLELPKVNAPLDSGNYSCEPQNLFPDRVTVHILGSDGGDFL